MFNAQYGNSLAMYGNIEEAIFQLPQQNYGAWPWRKKFHPINEIAAQPIKEIEIPFIDPSINVEIIKKLRQKLNDTEEITQRIEIREQIEKARLEKERQFKARARQDEEDAMFILF